MEKIKQKAKPKAHPKNYISNKDFTESLAKWIKENDGKERKNWSVMPDDVCKGLLKIINNYALKSSWRGYSYLEDMKSEAFYICLKYIHNFNIEKSQNGFAYATQAIKQSFIQYLEKEKKQSRIKSAVISKESPYNYNLINLHDEEE